MPRITRAAAASIRRVHGAQGDRWLADLPRRLTRCVEEWSLRVGDAAPSRNSWHNSHGDLPHVLSDNVSAVHEPAEPTAGRRSGFPAFTKLYHLPACRASRAKARRGMNPACYLPSQQRRPPATASALRPQPAPAGSPNPLSFAPAPSPAGAAQLLERGRLLRPLGRGESTEQRSLTEPESPRCSLLRRRRRSTHPATDPAPT